MKIKIILLISVFYLQACAAVHKVSYYDEFTDKALMNIQAKMDEYFTELARKHGTHEASFDSNKIFYNEIDKELKLLEFRAGAIPKNDITQKLIENIRVSILGKGVNDGFMQIHALPSNREMGPDITTINIQNKQITQAISVALQLEMEKKLLIKK